MVTQFLTYLSGPTQAQNDPEPGLKLVAISYFTVMMTYLTCM